MNVQSFGPIQSLRIEPDLTSVAASNDQGELDELAGKSSAPTAHTCVIVFQRAESAHLATQTMNDFEIGGRKIRVTRPPLPAMPPPTQPPHMVMLMPKQPMMMMPSNTRTWLV